MTLWKLDPGKGEQRVMVRVFSLAIDRRKGT
jgi:hypothetical protein